MENHQVSELLMQIVQRQNALLINLQKFINTTSDEHSALVDQLADIMGTSVAMLHLTEEGVGNLAETISDLKGLRGFTKTDDLSFFSPIQNIMFKRIFEIIALEKDMSIESVRNGLLIHCSKEIGFLSTIEKERDRKVKEEYLEICFYYFTNSYDLTVRTSMLILAYLDLYLIFTTSVNNTRVNGLFTKIRQIYFSKAEPIIKFNDIIPTPDNILDKQ